MIDFDREERGPSDTSADPDARPQLAAVPDRPAVEQHRSTIPGLAGAMSADAIRAFHAANAADDFARWQASLCRARGGRRACPCPRHTVERSLRHRAEPSIRDYDAADPAFLEQYTTACAEIVSLEEARLRRAATHVAIERLRGRVRPA
ncbi:MAG: hypothetical protein WCE83_10450 [Candidatus Baltobacteraceae bacterium]